ncbi:MAG TPA: glycosyltransferase [Candidatus Sumerlaeota bacterium]|nr:glycosyltransferase [Candidatus Sumerlaeota bacterium]
MKVLHVTSNIDPMSGGPARALMGLVLAQQRAGIECGIFSTWQGTLDRAFFRTFRCANVPVGLVGPCRAPFKRHPDLVAGLEVAMQGAEFVHIHALWEEVQHRAAIIARERGIPYLFRPCGMLDPWSLSQRKLGKGLYIEMRLRRDINRSAGLHFTSEEEKVQASPLKFTASSLVVENGVDLEEFRTMPPRGSFRAGVEAIADRRMILSLSRIHPKKGFDLLIPAFAKAQLQNTILVIAGSDDVGYMPTLLSLVEQHGVKDRVVFTGQLDSRRRLEALADADLFVLPSYQENFGIAVVEAAAAGLPCIISRNVNIQAEIVRAGAGDVVDLDANDLAEKLKAWMADDQRRSEAGRRARDFAFQRFDWDPIGRRWRDEYERIISEGRGR